MNKIEGIGYDFEFDIEDGPADPKNFWNVALVRVSTEGIEGFTDYQIYIGTPISLQANFSEVQAHINAFSGKSGVCVFGRGLLLVNEYDIDELEKAIYDEVNSLEYYAFDVS